MSETLTFLDLTTDPFLITVKVGAGGVAKDGLLGGTGAWKILGSTTAALGPLLIA